MNSVKLIKDSAKEVKSIISLCSASILSAIKIIIGGFTIPIIPNQLNIGFSHLVVALTGMYHGPVLAGLCGIVIDQIEFLLFPQGFYFPGFTLNAFLGGFISGLFFYQQKDITWKRVIIYRLTIVIIINLILTPLWINIMYGSPLLSAPRVIKQILVFPIDCILLYAVLKTALRIKPRFIK